MLEIIIGTVIILGAGIAIWYFGSWISKQHLRAIGFWANGKPMREKRVSDIPSYNRAYGTLLRIFSVPALCSGILLFLSAWWDFLALLSLIILILWGTAGIIWLILSYKKLENQYILR